MGELYLLPQRSKALRIRHKITLSILAEYMGISRDMLYLIESEHLNVDENVFEKIFYAIDAWQKYTLKNRFFLWSRRGK